MYHVIITRYHGDFKLAMCLRMNVLPLVKQLSPSSEVQVWDLADTAHKHPHIFQTGTNNRNTTLYRLELFRQNVFLVPSQFFTYLDCKGVFTCDTCDSALFHKSRMFSHYLWFTTFSALFGVFRAYNRIFPRLLHCLKIFCF